jgi:hypothetical protein
VQKAKALATLIRTGWGEETPVFRQLFSSLFMRQYFPRGTDLSRFSQAHLNRIALRLNQRPRKTLGFETPADKLRAVLH